MDIIYIASAVQPPPRSSKATKAPVELSLQEQAILANIQELQRQLCKVKMEQEKRETEEAKAKAKAKQVGSSSSSSSSSDVVGYMSLSFDDIHNHDASEG